MCFPFLHNAVRVKNAKTSKIVSKRRTATKQIYFIYWDLKPPEIVKRQAKDFFYRSAEENFNFGA